MRATGRDFMEVFKQRLEQVGAPVWPHCPMCNQQGWTMLLPTVDQSLKEAFPGYYRTLALNCAHCGYLVNFSGDAPAYADLFPDKDCSACRGTGIRGEANKQEFCECWDRNEKA